MFKSVGGSSAALLFRDKISRQDKTRHDSVESKVVVPNLDVTIERAPQGSRTCRLCADVSGRYPCLPTASRCEWRYAETGMHWILSLVQRERDASPRLKAALLVESEGRAHTRAVYTSEPLGTEPSEGPWRLKLRFEVCECHFVFPVHVEVIASGRLSLANPLN